MLTRFLSLALWGSLLTAGHAYSQAESALQARADPNDIMMFVCQGADPDLTDLCMSMCFGSFCAGNGQSLTWDKPGAPTQHARARAAGCRPTPNRCSKSPYGSNFECDEFPFKSVQDVSGGTRVNRCVPKAQNQKQGQITRAYYAKNGYCKATAPCSFNTGYENSGEVKYCQQETCENDGNEYTKGGEFDRRDLSGAVDAEYTASNVTAFGWSTHFRTAEGTEVRIPAGARIGQTASRMVIRNVTAFNEYIEDRMIAEANMTEEEYWDEQAAPASERLLSLVDIELTTIVEALN